MSQDFLTLKKNLASLKGDLIKKGFIASPLMEQQIAEAQEKGAIAPPPPEDPNNPNAQQPDPLEQVAMMLQEGFGIISQGQQQIAQMLQQVMASGVGGEGKKLSDKERLDRIESQLAQLTQGGGAPMPPEAMPPEAMPPEAMPPGGDPVAQGAPQM